MKRTLIGLALVVLAFVHRGWVVFTLMPLLALQGIGTPALQARATRGVDSALQGQLQGVLASAVSAASIVAPLAFTALYQRFRPWWPGAIWLSVIAMLLAGTGAVTIAVALAEMRATARAIRKPPEHERADSGEL